MLGMQLILLGLCTFMFLLNIFEFKMDKEQCRKFLKTGMSARCCFFQVNFESFTAKWFIRSWTYLAKYILLQGIGNKIFYCLMWRSMGK